MHFRYRCARRTWKDKVFMRKPEDHIVKTMHAKKQNMPNSLVVYFKIKHKQQQLLI